MRNFLDEEVGEVCRSGDGTDSALRASCSVLLLYCFSQSRCPEPVFVCESSLSLSLSLPTIPGGPVSGVAITLLSATDTETPSATNGAVQLLSEQSVQLATLDSYPESSAVISDPSLVITRHAAQAGRYRAPGWLSP